MIKRDECSFVVLMRENGGVIYYFLWGGASPSSDPSPSIYLYIRTRKITNGLTLLVVPKAVVSTVVVPMYCIEDHVSAL